MFSHMMVGSNDIERSRKFYDATFAAMGGRPGKLDSKGRLAYSKDGATFLVTPPINSQPATHGNGATIGFLMNPDQVHAWHEAGVANGGSAIEDPPGVRKGETRDLYLAYLRDPDGNKLCALHPRPAE